MRIKNLILFSLLALSLVVTGCKSDSAQQPLRLQGEIFGTYWFVTYLDPWDKQLNQELTSKINQALQKVDLAMSTYKPDSELNQLNQAHLGVWVKVSPDTFEVLALAQDISTATDGAFDVTLGGLVNLWNFGPEKHSQQPTSEEITAALNEIGYQYLELDRDNLSARRMKNSFIDLSGIAKGYAVDKVAEAIRSLGGENFLVNIGGEIYAAGLRAEEQKWRIGIEVPGPQQQEAQHILHVSQMSIATSGDYRNFYEIDGEEFSHTISPQTGKPIKDNLKSVTVLHPSNAVADAWATAFMAAGLEKGQELASKHKIKALFISKTSDNFNTSLSPSIQSYLGKGASQELLKTTTD